MPYRKLPAEQARTLLAERIVLAQQRIEAAVASLQSGVQWRDYLVLQSRLHSYSARNVWLLTVQHHDAWERGVVATPWPSCVAGFQAWRSLGRSVDKGQRGYQILAPYRHLQRTAVDGEGHARTIGRDDDPAPGEQVQARQVVGGFRVEHVWDLNQTSGDPLPEPAPPVLLRGQAPDGLWDAIADQVRNRGFTVRLVPSADDLQGANGRVTWGSRVVEVRADMDDAARCKSLLHELGHCLLHDPHASSGPTDGRQAGRGAKEVEAESVAFIVADAHGLSTGDYTFPYVSAWAGLDGVATVQASASRVAAAAKDIITASSIAHNAGGRPPVLHVGAGPAHEELSALAPADRSRLLQQASVQPTTLAPGLS